MLRCVCVYAVVPSSFVRPYPFKRAMRSSRRRLCVCCCSLVCFSVTSPEKALVAATFKVQLEVDPCVTLLSWKSQFMRVTHCQRLEESTCKNTQPGRTARGSRKLSLQVQVQVVTMCELESCLELKGAQGLPRVLVLLDAVHGSL